MIKSDFMPILGHLFEDKRGARLSSSDLDHFLNYVKLCEKDVKKFQELMQRRPPRIDHYNWTMNLFERTWAKDRKAMATYNDKAKMVATRFIKGQLMSDPGDLLDRPGPGAHKYEKLAWDLFGNDPSMNPARTLGQVMRDQRRGLRLLLGPASSAKENTEETAKEK